MLKIVEKGIIYKGKLYEISKNDVKWLLEENKKTPRFTPS